MPTSAELEEKLAADPENLDLWLELALALELEGHPLDAVALAHEVVNRDPQRKGARAMLERLSSKTRDLPARPPGVRTSRRATLRGLFSKNKNEPGAAKAGERGPSHAGDSSDLLESFDRTEGAALEPRAKRPPVLEISEQLFPGMPADALLELAAGVKRITFETGEVVLREGEPGDAFYLIEEGTARVLKRDPAAPGGDFVEVGGLVPGNLFGEFAVLADRRRHATVVAASKLEVVEIGRSLLARLSRSYPELTPILDCSYRERLLDNLVATAPFLQVIEKSRRHQLAEKFIPVRAAAGETVVCQGQRAGGFYLVVLGGVDIVKTVGNSTRLSVATLREGDYFGELSLLRGDVARANVNAVGETELLMLPPQDFYDLIAEHPVLWEEVRAEAERRETELYALVTGKAALV